MKNMVIYIERITKVEREKYIQTRKHVAIVRHLPNTLPFREKICFTNRDKGEGEGEGVRV